MGPRNLEHSHWVLAVKGKLKQVGGQVVLLEERVVEYALGEAGRGVPRQAILALIDARLYCPTKCKWVKHSKLVLDTIGVVEPPLVNDGRHHV